MSSSSGTGFFVICNTVNTELFGTQMAQLLPSSLVLLVCFLFCFTWFSLLFWIWATLHSAQQNISVPVTSREAELIQIDWGNQNQKVSGVVISRLLWLSKRDRERKQLGNNVSVVIRLCKKIEGEGTGNFIVLSVEIGLLGSWLLSRSNLISLGFRPQFQLGCETSAQGTSFQILDPVQTQWP